MAIDLQAAIAVFDKSADRTRPNAQTEAWAVIREALARAVEDARRWNELVETWGGMHEVAGHHVLIGVSTPRWKVPIGVESFNEAFDRRYELEDAATSLLAAPAGGEG